MDLRETMLSELRVSQRILRDGHLIEPRLTIFGPDGSHAAMIDLPEDTVRRTESLRSARLFMVWKAAYCFVLSNKAIDADDISVVAITRANALSVIQRIRRSPLGFAAPEWFGRETVGDEIINLLPPKSLQISPDEIGFMGQAFEAGKIPGIRWNRCTPK